VVIYKNGSNLREWKYKVKKTAGASKGKPVHITDESGSTNRPPTKCQLENGKSVGSAITHNWFICRQYFTKDESTTYRPPSVWCKDCHMPICNSDRTGEDGGQECSCLDEHCCAEDPFFQCNTLHKKAINVPKGKQISLWPRRSKRSRSEP